jgi:hypothetical protein
MHDNPYDPPEALPQEVPCDEEIVIRPREHFTGFAILTAGAEYIVMLLICGAIAHGALTNHWPYGEFIAAVAVIVLLLFMASTDGGPGSGRLADRILQFRHGVGRRPDGAFVAELTFETRRPALTKRGIDGADTADDLGILHCEGERLHFYGDSSCIDLHAQDIEAIEPMGYGGPAGLLGRRTRVVLAREISGQTSFYLCIREGAIVWRMWRRAREMQEAVIAWHQSHAS